ncbi:MAG: hypothetical protein KZQ73_07165, partial [Candidatus Thiodiazotropha sp. (ex Semelilucina semeliformis)]|nr:hypothetical protein [Candidatus Thiodiazotropha sp. (ex Semelilucina semeliformis)]
LALRAGRGLLTLGKRMIRGAVSRVAQLGRRLWTGGRQLVDDLIDFATRGRTTRSFERAPFGQFRLKDLSISLGDWRVRVNSIWLDPSLRGMNRLATFLHEGVHWTSNQFLPNLARMKQFTNNSGLRGFIGSNVKFYEESVAYTVGGIVGTFSRQGFKTRWREVIGFLPAWQRSLRNKSIARRHVVMGLPFVAGAGYGLYQAWDTVFGDGE